MSRHQNHNDAPSPTKKRFYHMGYSTACSDANHVVLFLVMMQLGIVDFVSFSGVCKSWRSLALSNWNIFMASRPPVLIRITDRPYKKKKCYLELEESEGRKFKTLIPHSGGRNFVGLTRGYLVFFGWETHDFWVVNPITRHDLHFPAYPYSSTTLPTYSKTILVFCPSLSEWVLVISRRFPLSIWFSVAGSRSWTNVPCNSSVIADLHFFKEKIYVLTINCLYVFELYPKPEFTLLQTKNFPHSSFTGKFVSTGANFIVMHRFSNDPVQIHELDLDEMKWVCCEKIEEEYAFFYSFKKNIAAVKLDLWADLRSQYRKYVVSDKSFIDRFFTAALWYFPHDCLNVNLIHESHSS